MSLQSCDGEEDQDEDGLKTFEVSTGNTEKVVGQFVWFGIDSFWEKDRIGEAKDAGGVTCLPY